MYLIHVYQNDSLMVIFMMLSRSFSMYSRVDIFLFIMFITSLFCDECVVKNSINMVKQTKFRKLGYINLIKHVVR